jgi:hypothetical protein
VRLVSTSRVEHQQWIVAAGILLVVSVAYALSGPGRIDMIDGQFRYEVAVNIMNDGHPVIRDPALRWGSLTGRHGLRYSYYNASGSVAGLPLVWLGRVTNHSDETQRFLFSFTSAIAGGLLASALYLFYRALDVEERRALGWTAVSAFGTLLWPLATSTFDQAQHAVLVLLAIQLGRASARRGSIWLAVTAGLPVALLLNYQETYLLLAPALALSTMNWSTASWTDQDSYRRCCGFLSASGIGILGWLAYNAARFGKPVFFLDKLSKEGHPAAAALLGNPVVGLLGLTVSPGKSVLLYSPPLLLGLLGMRQLWRRDPVLGLTLMMVSIIHLLFVSSLRFFGSDWAWGPRYLVVLLPLWALAFPFVDTATIRRSVVVAVVSLGILVQVMAVTVDHQRFFFERALPDHFWAEDQWFYFRESALLARSGEIAVSLRDGVPQTAKWFAPHPYPDALTYSIFGNTRRELAPVWMRQFQVFYLPRPWPLWMRTIPPDRRPVRLGPVVLGLLAVALLGAGLIHWGSRVRCPNDHQNRP